MMESASLDVEAAPAAADTEREELALLPDVEPSQRWYTNT